MGRRDYRSWSQMSGYEQCPEAYRLERVEKVPSKPAVWFPAGTAYHSATEQFDRYAVEYGLKSAVEVGGWDTTYLAEFESELDEIREVEPDESKWRVTSSPLVKWKATGETADWWREFGPKMVTKYVDWRAANKDKYRIYLMPNGSPALELEYTVLHGTVMSKGSTDAILEDIETGATIGVDRKTGKSKPKNLDQLGWYMVTGEQALNPIKIWYGAFFMARSGTLTEPEPLDDYRDGRLAQRLAEMDRDERQGLYPAKPSHLCNWCGVNAFCATYQGGLKSA